MAAAAARAAESLLRAAEDAREAAASDARRRDARAAEKARELEAARAPGASDAGARGQWSEKRLVFEGWT